MKHIDRALKLTIVENLKLRNAEDMEVTAIDYYGTQFSYQQLFEKIELYKNAFIHLCGESRKPVTIVTPTIPSSIFAFYGAMDANKIINLTSPGFITAYTKKYTTELDSDTVVILDKFLSDPLIDSFVSAGVKNLIVTSIADYMQKAMLHPSFSTVIKKRNDIAIYTVPEFEKIGKIVDKKTEFHFQKGQIAAYFLTGGTTSKFPKGVKLYAEGINKMAELYEDMWFDFEVGARHTLFIPLYYATGAVHGMHAGLFCGMTLCPRPIYNRFAFAKDLLETKAEIALVAPSHVATLSWSDLPENALKGLKYIFIGGEAINPAQMKKFRATAKYLGIEYILNGYGMTETGSMSGISNKIPESSGDVTVYPIPQVTYRIVDPDTRAPASFGQRGVLEVHSPCATAGYLDEELNHTLFTSDGWVHTGDIAVQTDSGGYRVFGRATDYFSNQGHKYAMFDMEEKLLEHPGIMEAEAVKFTTKEGERVAFFVVLSNDYRGQEEKVLLYISQMDIPGMEYLLGTKFIEKFTTNPVTAKRDYLILEEIKDGYLKYEADNKSIWKVSVSENGTIIKRND